MVRAFLLLCVLSGLAWWLHGEQERGRFHAVDEGFLDFLLANVRDELKPDPAKLDDVVLVQLREEDKKEFAAWPPLPIDYQMILDRLAAHQPRAVVIVDSLQWPKAKAEELEPLAVSLQKVAPRVVLTASVSSQGDANAEALNTLRERLPVITRVEGDVTSLPVIARADATPDASLMRQGDVGLTIHGALPLVMRLGDALVPSLQLQALANAGGVAFGQLRINVGPGAGLHLGDEWFVPALTKGLWMKPETKVVTVNALDVMTPELAEAGDAWKKALGTGRVLVIGTDHDGGEPSMARTTAMVLANALALPRLRVLPELWQFTTWAVCGLLGMALLWWPKQKAITRAILLLVLALTASYLAFQSFQTWCPPAIPVTLIVASGLFVRLFGRRQIEPPTAKTE
jgi:CHASE2 domain-containing sensor protein